MSRAELKFGLAGELGDRSLSVRRFVVHERISRPFSITVMARSPDPSLELSTIVGMPVALEVDVEQPFANAGQQRWSGICRAIEQEQAEPTGLSTYRLELAPQLWLLTQRSDYRIFRHANVQRIVSTVLREHGIEAMWAVNPAVHPKLDFKVQYGETDFDFISRLLEEAGIAYTFINTPLGSMLTMSDLWHMQPPRMAPPLPALDAPPAQASEEYIADVQLAHEVRPGTHALVDYDLSRPAFDLSGIAAALPIPTSPASLLPSVEARCEHYSYRPGGALIEAGQRMNPELPLNPTPDVPTDVPTTEDRSTPERGGDARHDEAFAHIRAQRILAALRAGRESIAFCTNAIDLRPGGAFMMTHPHPELIGRLLSTELVVEGSEDNTWTIRGRAVLGDKPYHPPLLTPRPRARGIQSATVVAAQDEDIHTDGFGRVRVQFPWDRRGRKNPQSSCWLRVNQGWGGAGYGMQNIPRVGQEVLVSFLDGDPEQPVVMGRAHNATQPVPYALPEHKTVSTWRTESSIGLDGFNELKFEDRAGDELYYLQAEKDLTKLVKNDEVITVGHDREKTVNRHETDTTEQHRTEVTGHDRTQAVGEAFVTTVGETRRERVDRDLQYRVAANNQELVVGDQDVVVGRTRKESVSKEAHFTSGARSQKIRQKQSLMVTQDQHEKVTGNHALQANGEIYLHANRKIIAEAPNDVTILGPGGGFIRIDDEGVTIYGALVEINVGGDPGQGTPCNPERSRSLKRSPSWTTPPSRLPKKTHGARKRSNRSKRKTKSNPNRSNPIQSRSRKMLRITRQQRETYAELKRRRLAAKSRWFLEEVAPNWCSDKTDDRKQNFVERIIALAYLCNVFEESNIRKLLLLKIEHDFMLPLSDYRRRILGRAHLDETTRVHQFIETVEARRELETITLDTDLVGREGRA